MAIHPQCHLLAVLGGKGGVGKSTFAANLACACLADLKQPTLLIDLDSQSCGDQNVLTGLRPLKTIGEISTHNGAINAQNIFSLVTRHPSGLGFVGAVHRPDESLSVVPDLLMRQLEALSSHFRFIVVDIGNQMGAVQLQILEQSSAALVVTVPEVLALNQTTRILADLAAATLPNELFQIVVNRASPSGLSTQAIAGALRRPVIGAVPQDDVTVVGALQRSTPFVLSQPRAPVSLAYYEIVRKLTGGIVQKLKAQARGSGAAASLAKSEASSAGASEVAAGAARASGSDSRTAIKLRCHAEVVADPELKMGLTDTDGDPAKEKALRNKTQAVIAATLDKEAPGLAREERMRIIKEVLDEALGLGPLEELLADGSVTEIMVNGCDKIFIEKSGKLTLSQSQFTSNLQLRNVIDRIVAPLGRRIDEKTPYVDARLRDGSRVNAVIEPLAIDGPAVTIRKFSKSPMTPEKYIEYGSLTKSMLDFLRICVENGLNIIISGGTGSGKTTLLNCLSSFIPSTERIITVEDAAELQLRQQHVVRLETRPASLEGSNAITIRDLVRNSLRMRPDRIVVGECRDGAALDMLSAMNTGHDGSMTTVHANNPREAVARLETLCLMAGMDLPSTAIREQIAGAVDIIIQISRLSDGSRKVLSLTEVAGIQSDRVTLEEIFRFKEEGFDKNRKIVGVFQATGMIPSFLEKLERKGVAIPRSLFSNAAPAAPASPMPARPGAAPSASSSVTKKSGTGGAA